MVAMRRQVQLTPFHAMQLLTYSDPSSFSYFNLLPLYLCLAGKDLDETSKSISAQISNTRKVKHKGDCYKSYTDPEVPVRRQNTNEGGLTGGTN